MQNNCGSQVIFGGFFVRLAAYLIDGVVVWAGLCMVRILITLCTWLLSDSVFSSPVLFTYTLKDVILYLCGAAYFILLTYYTGTTLGKRAMNLRVGARDGSRLSLFTVIYRETVGRFLCCVTLGIGYIMAGLDREKRGLHDILCDTCVVYEKRVNVVPVPIRIPKNQAPREQMPQSVISPNVPLGQTGAPPFADQQGVNQQSMHQQIQEGTSHDETRGF